MPLSAEHFSFLADIKLMQLATCANSQPWLCNVWYVLDEDIDLFYFISRKTRRHCKEIAQNPNVACTIHGAHNEGLGEKGRALIFAGQAKCLEGEQDWQKPYDLYAARYPALLDFQTKAEFETGTNHHFFYEIRPTEIIFWDEQSGYDNPRQVIL